MKLSSHADIRDAILTLVGATREQTDKLLRHEMRERQLGDALTRTLSYIDARSRSQEKNLENLSAAIARMDNRIRKTEEMIQQVMHPPHCKREEKEKEKEREKKNDQFNRSFVTICILRFKGWFKETDEFID